MAAHIITAFNSTFFDEKHPPTVESINHFGYALGMAQFGDLLDMDEWIVLRRLCLSAKDAEHDTLHPIKTFWWTYVMNRVYAEWEALGEPENCEDWFSRKYSR